MITAAILRAGRRPSNQKAFAGAPDETPDFIGQVGVNTATGTIYLAGGTAAVADWVPVTTADGGAVVYNADQEIYQVIKVGGGEGLENVEITDFVA